MNRRKAIKQTALLLGGAISASVIAGVMNGCKPTYSIDWQPKFLSKDQAIMVGEMTETILPETDTLGAKSLHVDEFIDLIINDNFSGFDKLQFTKGLEELDAKCQFFAGKPFLSSSSQERAIFLVLTERDALEKWRKTGEKPFFITFKELTLLGFFTSEYAINELMNYNPLPQKYEGCINYNGQKVQIGIEGRST